MELGGSGFHRFLKKPQRLSLSTKIFKGSYHFIFSVVAHETTDFVFKLKTSLQAYQFNGDVFIIVQISTLKTDGKQQMLRETFVRSKEENIERLTQSKLAKVSTTDLLANSEIRSDHSHTGTRSGATASRLHARTILPRLLTIRAFMIPFPLSFRVLHCEIVSLNYRMYSHQVTCKYLPCTRSSHEKRRFPRQFSPK